VACGVSGLCGPEDSAWEIGGDGKLSQLPEGGLFSPGEDDLCALRVQGDL
jgi:hypothetical protein